VQIWIFTDYATTNTLAAKYLCAIIMVGISKQSTMIGKRDKVMIKDKDSHLLQLGIEP